MAPLAVREARRWRYGLAETASWRAPGLHYGHNARLDVVRHFLGALWDQSQPHLRGDQQNVPASWWDSPLSCRMLFVGWCQGLLPRQGGDVVGFLATGWLPCAKRGHMYVGRAAHAAAIAIQRNLPDVWEVWDFSLPPPAMARATTLVQRVLPQAQCWHLAVARERLYRATVASVEEWHAKQTPVNRLLDAPKHCP